MYQFINLLFYLSQFLFSLYHELSSPVNAISMGMIDIREQVKSADGKVTLALAEQSCLRINETLKNLIHYQV